MQELTVCLRLIILLTQEVFDNPLTSSHDDMDAARTAARFRGLIEV